jgi:hypothetical protein
LLFDKPTRTAPKAGPTLDVICAVFDI